RERYFGAQVLEHLRPHLLGAVEPIETAEHAAVARLDGRRLAQRVDGFARLREMLFEPTRGFYEERELQVLIVGRAELDAPSVELDELFMIAPALVELDQRIDGESALGFELERALVGDRGPFRVVEHVALGFADAAEERRLVF